MIKKRCLNRLEIFEQKEIQVKGVKMKWIWIIALLTVLSSCGTFGGAVRGLGSDLDIVGSYITDF